MRVRARSCRCSRSVRPHVERAGYAVLRGAEDAHRDERAELVLRRLDMDGLEIRAAADELAEMTSRTVEQHRQHTAAARLVEAPLLRRQHLLQRRQSRRLGLLRNLVRPRSRRPRPRALLQTISLTQPNIP